MGSKFSANPLTVNRVLNISRSYSNLLSHYHHDFSGNMISPLYAIGGLLLAYIGLSTLQLLYNYKKAKSIGLPVLITPIDPSVRLASLSNALQLMPLECPIFALQQLLGASLKKDSAFWTWKLC